MPARDSAPDLRVLAAYVRNRLTAGETAEFWVKGARVFIVPLPAQQALLVASERGESLLLTGAEPVHASTFVAGRFSLQRAAMLSRLFNVLRDTTGTLRKRK